jgi:hypothetical protein
MMFEEGDIVQECPDCHDGFHRRHGSYGSQLVLFVCDTCGGHMYIPHDHD